MNILKHGSFLCCLLAVLSATSPSANAQSDANCGSPTFDRFEDRGLFVWQDCSNGNWFFRATNGGQPGEFTVDGRLRLSEDIQAPAPFNLNNIGVQDIFDLSNPQNVLFTFRVFGDAQDGINFRLAADSSACLLVSTSDGSPIIIGSNNLELNSPLNINTVSAAGCVTVAPINLLLLNEEEG